MTSCTPENCDNTEAWEFLPKLFFAKFATEESQPALCNFFILNLEKSGVVC